MVLAGRLDFNPLTDSLIGADGEEFKVRCPSPAFQDSCCLVLCNPLMVGYYPLLTLRPVLSS